MSGLLDIFRSGLPAQRREELRNKRIKRNERNSLNAPDAYAPTASESEREESRNKLARTLGRGVRGDGLSVSWDGFALDGEDGVMLCADCDGAGCDRCDDTGLQRAFEVAGR